MKTTFPVSAPPPAWAGLVDPDRLVAALPGCRSVTRDAAGDGTLHVVTEIAVASVRGLWAGTVTPVDADAVQVRGTGAPGTVDLVVRADPERTRLTVEGTVDGPLGTVGSAVLASAVRRMAEDLLATTGAPTAASPRGDELHRDELEAIRSRAGTHDFGLAVAETVPPGTPGGRRARGVAGAAVVGVVIAVIVRRRARGR